MAQTPSWLVARGDLGVIVCAEHGSSYVRATLDRHLRDVHKMTFGERSEIIIPSIKKQDLSRTDR